MSLGYAQKLSYREDVGAVGMAEIFELSDVLHKKIEEFAMLIQKSKHLVAFTGAGISTSSGIPDFRGPKGIWTLQQAGKVLPEASLPFHRAMPSLTHMALVELEKAGGKFVKWTIKISSVDGLKAPLPFLKSVEISFPDTPDMGSALLLEQPFSLTRETIKSRSLKMLLQLNFAEGCGYPFLKLEKAIDFLDSLESFTCEKSNLVQQLRDESLQESKCGKHVMLERKFSSNPSAETTTYGIVTSLLTYNEPKRLSETGVSESNGACMLKRRASATVVKDEGPEISCSVLDTCGRRLIQHDGQVPERNNGSLCDEKLVILREELHSKSSELKGQNEPTLILKESEVAYSNLKAFKRKRTHLTSDGVRKQARETQAGLEARFETEWRASQCSIQQRKRYLNYQTLTIRCKEMLLQQRMSWTLSYK